MDVPRELSLTAAQSGEGIPIIPDLGKMVESGAASTSTKMLSLAQLTELNPIQDGFGYFVGKAHEERRLQMCLEADALAFRRLLMGMRSRASASASAMSIWTHNTITRPLPLPLIENPVSAGPSLTTKPILPTKDPADQCRILISELPDSSSGAGLETQASASTSSGFVGYNGSSATSSMCGDSSGQHSSAMGHPYMSSSSSSSGICVELASSCASKCICLICGHVAQPKAGFVSPADFYHIGRQMLIPDASAQKTIYAMLNDLLRINLVNSTLIPSEFVCKNCYRQLNEIDFLEKQLSREKNALVSRFYRTVAGMRNHTGSGKSQGQADYDAAMASESVSEDRLVFSDKMSNEAFNLDNKLMAADEEASPENTSSSNDDAECAAGDSVKTRERMTRRYVRQQQLLQQEKMQSGGLGPDTSDDASNEASDVQLRSNEECSFFNSSPSSKETLSTSASSSSPASVEGQNYASESKDGYGKKQSKKRRHRGFSPEQEAKRSEGQQSRPDMEHNRAKSGAATAGVK